MGARPFATLATLYLLVCSVNVSFGAILCHNFWRLKFGVTKFWAMNQEYVLVMSVCQLFALLQSVLY